MQNRRRTRDWTEVREGSVEVVPGQQMGRGGTPGPVREGRAGEGGLVAGPPPVVIAPSSDPGSLNIRLRLGEPGGNGMGRTHLDRPRPDWVPLKVPWDSLS